MADLYGSDFITVSGEDGKEYEFEVLSSTEYNGNTYLAVIPAENAEDEMQDLGVSIYRSAEDESGEPTLCPIEDIEELQAVHDLIMDSLFPDTED